MQSIKRGGSRPGAGRKAIGEKRVMSITLPPDVWAALEAEAERDGIKVPTLMREIVSEYINIDKYAAK